MPPRRTTPAGGDAVMARLEAFLDQLQNRPAPPPPPSVMTPPGRDRLTEVETILERVEGAIHRMGNDAAKRDAENRTALDKQEARHETALAKIEERLNGLDGKFITRSEFNAVKMTAGWIGAAASGAVAIASKLVFRP